MLYIFYFYYLFLWKIIFICIKKWKKIKWLFTKKYKTNYINIKKEGLKIKYYIYKLFI